jgi:tetratricopeptide (TPR) repeat protein
VQLLRHITAVSGLTFPVLAVPSLPLPSAPPATETADAAAAAATPAPHAVAASRSTSGDAEAKATVSGHPTASSKRGGGGGGGSSRGGGRTAHASAAHASSGGGGAGPSSSSSKLSAVDALASDLDAFKKKLVAFGKAEDKAKASGEEEPTRATVDNSWLRDLHACRLNRYSLGATVASKFAALDFVHGVGGSADVLASKAELLYAQHDPGSALAVSRRALALDPFHRPLLLLHYALLVEMREPDELHRLAQSAMLAAPKGVCLVHEDALCVSKVFIRASTCFCYSRCAADAASWYAAGCYYVAAGRPSAAVQHLTRATQLEPSLAQAWVALGVAYSATEDTEPALAAYRAAQRLWPHSHVPALAMSGLALRQVCRCHPRSTDISQIMMSLNPCSPWYFTVRFLGQHYSGASIC